jgi:AcrR family transcriptional regulator
MADIAEAVQLQKASLYHHFSSKQEILLELLDRELQMVTEHMAEVMAREISADQKLRLAMRTYLKTLSEQGDLVSVLLLEFRSLEPDFFARHVPNRDRFERMWRDLIQQGVDEGAFYCDNVSMASRGLLGAMNWTVTWYRRNGPMTMEQIADYFADLFLQGLSVAGKS